MYRSDTYIHTYYYKHVLRNYLRNSYYSTRLQIENEKSFFSTSMCREAIVRTLASVALKDPDYNLIIDIKPQCPDGIPVFEKISEVLDMDLSFLPVEDRLLIFGNTASFQNFNFGISFILYVIKYMSTVNWLLDKKLVATQKLNASSYNDAVKIPTGFLWYLSYVENIRHLEIPITNHNVQQRNGISSFVWNGLFNLYPDLVRVFSKYLDSVRGGAKFKRDYCNSYIRIDNKKSSIGAI